MGEYVYFPEDASIDAKVYHGMQISTEIISHKDTPSKDLMQGDYVYQVVPFKAKFIKII